MPNFGRELLWVDAPSLAVSSLRRALYLGADSPTVQHNGQKLLISILVASPVIVGGGRSHEFAPRCGKRP